MPSESPPSMAVTFPLPPRPSTVPPMTSSTVPHGSQIPNNSESLRRDSEDVTTMSENRENRKISESIDNCNNQEIITHQLTSQPSTSQAPPPQQPVKPAVTVLLDQERYLPIANVVRLMKGMMDPSAKLAKDAKECVQECVSEFISFIASEAAEICNQTRKKTIGADELLTAMEACGFDNYSEPMRIFLQKYRQAKKMSGPPHITHPNYVRPPQFARDPPVQPLFYETETGATKCTEMEDPRAKNMIHMTMSNNDYIQHEQHSYQGTEDISKGGHGGYVDDWNLHNGSSAPSNSARIPPPGTTVILTGRGGVDQLVEDDEEEGGGGGVRRHLTQDEDGNIYEEVQLDEVSMHDYNGHHLSHHHHNHNHNQIIDGMEEDIEEIVGGDDGDGDDNQMGAIALEQQQQMQIYIDPKSKQHYAAKETPNGMELYPLIIQNTPLHLENVTGASQYVLNLEDGSTGHVMIPDDSMPSTSSAPHYSSSSYHQNSPSTSSSSLQNPTGRHLENQKAQKRRKPNYMSQEDSMGGFRSPDDVTLVRQQLDGMEGPPTVNKKTPPKRRRH